jgi:HlyD family secretion protein
LSTRLRRSLYALVLILLVGAVLWYLTRPEPVTVPVAEAERGTVEETVANTRAGTVEAVRRAKIAPDISGRVTRLPVDDGDGVKAGDILLALWNEDLRAERDLARARLAAARAQAEQACLRADHAAREADRLARLHKKEMASEEEVDRAETEREATAAACRAARAEVQVAENRLKAARARLDRTILHAPFAGIVAEVSAELGEIVSPSPPGIPTPPAVDLIDTDGIHVTAPIDEVDAPRIRVGMPARIHLDAFPDRSFAGEVQRIADYVRDVEKQARTVAVEVAFRHPEEVPGLMPGYSADAEIILQRRDDTLRIPTEAITEGAVLVLTGEGRLQRRSIETGLSNWEYTEVTGGLGVEDRVVLTPGREGVAPGIPAVAEGDGQP